MALQIVFGWYLDGPSFPETADGSKATLGRLIAGPAGLINQLALRSGLVRPLIPQAVRIANYLAALREIDDGNQHYSASFGIDAWSTASYLLVLRDELVANGWSPEKDSDLGPKVESLARAEAVAKNIAGVADLTRAVMSCMERSRKTCDISSIELVTERGRLPSSWQKLLAHLALNGTDISQRAASSAAPAHSDLGKVQRLFNGEGSAQLLNDGTFTLLDADDEIQASEALAAYLVADTNKNSEVVLIRGANTALLDEACSVQDLPRIGGEVKSRWRSIPQLLPLAIGNRWNPADPLVLLEFLSLPLLPVPRDVCYRFAKALRSEPGFGGAQWHEAWTEALRKNHADHELDGSARPIQGKPNHFESELRYWLLPSRFDPYEGIPAHELIALSSRIQRWALQKAHSDSATSEMVMELYELCKCFEAVHFAEMKILDPIDDRSGSESQKRKSTFTTPCSAQTTPKIPYRVIPSHSHKSLADVLSIFWISNRMSFGPRILMMGTDEMQIIGDVVHSFLAADDVERTTAERMQLGHDLLSGWKISSLKAFDLITISNRLTRAIANNFPGATAFRECPVTGLKGLQRMRGSVDLLLRTSEGYIVIDHKTYPGRMDTWETKCLSYAPQLYSYKQVVEDSGAGTVIGCYIHLPLLGQLLKIDVNQSATFL